MHYDAGMLIRGNGSEPNFGEGVRYLKIAVDKGFPLALEFYAYVLNYGVLIEKKRREAIKYYKMAIEKGCSDAKEEY